MLCKLPPSLPDFQGQVLEGEDDFWGGLQAIVVFGARDAGAQEQEGRRRIMEEVSSGAVEYSLVQYCRMEVLPRLLC